MNKSQQRQIERLRRVAGFGSNFESDFTASSKARALFKEAAALVETLDNKPKKTRGGRGPERGFSSEKLDAWRNLRDNMERIARTAREIEKENPAFAGKFIVPDKRRKTELASAARQFLEEAEPVKNEFLSFEMSKTFLKELNAALTDYEKADSKPAKAPAARGGANSALKEVLTRALELTETLDVIIHNKYNSKPEALEAWQNANKLEFTPRRRGRKPKAAAAA